MAIVDVFAQRLKDLRIQRGLSLNQLAKDIGVTAQSLSLYENSKRTINIDLLNDIAKYFNVSADYLIGLSDTQSLDTDMQAVCKYTGLSEDAVKRLRIIYNGSPSMAFMFKNEENVQIMDVVNKLFCDKDFSPIFLKLYLLSIKSQNTVDVKHIEEYMCNSRPIHTRSVERIIKKITGKTDANVFKEMELNEKCNLLRYEIENKFSRVVDNFDNRIRVKQSIPTEELQKLLDEESEDNNAKHKSENE